MTVTAREDQKLCAWVVIELGVGLLRLLLATLLATGDSSTGDIERTLNFESKSDPFCKSFC